MILAMARRLTHMGPIGAGQTTKLCNQVIVGCAMVVLAEATRLAVNAGIDAGRLPESERLRDPNAGYTQAYTDEAIVFLYIVAEIVFLIVAPFLMTRRPSLRSAFWAIAISFRLPLCRHHAVHARRCMSLGISLRVR